MKDPLKLFAGTCEFVRGVPNLEALPPDNLPEIAFAGRSNVGKSSLLNALTGRKALARTSNTPGRTQQLNFFNLGDVLYLVDMPGYGYAKVSKTLVKSWTELLKTYLRGRVSLKRTFLLVDARHGIKENDREMMAMLDETASAYTLVLTKIDKVKDQALVALIAEIEEALKKHPAAYPHPLATSAEKKRGIEELQTAIIKEI